MNAAPDPAATDALPHLRQWLPLLQESLAQQGRFRWRMRGASMTPTLPPGCEIEIAPAPAAIPLGALLVFVGNASLVAHRLVHRTPAFLVTQGDNRREPDPWLRPNQVLGLVTAAYQDERHIWPGALEPALRWWWIGRADLLWLLRRLKELVTR
jgi:hypothetical protein